jgi:hypothetical protein
MGSKIGTWLPLLQPANEWITAHRGRDAVHPVDSSAVSRLALQRARGVPGGSLAAKQGPTVLFCIPNGTKCILLEVVFGGARPCAGVAWFEVDREDVLHAKRSVLRSAGATFSAEEAPPPEGPAPLHPLRSTIIAGTRVPCMAAK